MSDDVSQVFPQAADASVELDQVQAAACRHISAAFQTDAALVTSGASASLLLGAAAILARFDLAIMDRLPDSSGIHNELIVARNHRNGYDHAVRTAGAKLVEVGLDELSSGAGVRRCELWEYEAAMHSGTAGILYALTDVSKPPLNDVVKLAHAKNLPVLVDAAAEVTSVTDMQKILATGADLIAVSGGKSLGGPQSTGILCGSKELVGSAFLQMMDNDDHFELWQPPEEFVTKSMLRGIPRHGIGRPLKVSKESILALLVAIDQIQQTDQKEKRQNYVRWLELLEKGISKTLFACRLIDDTMPTLEIEIPADANKNAFEVCRQLRQSDPSIYVGHGKLEEGIVVINPSCLSEDQLAPLEYQIVTQLESI